MGWNRESESEHGAAAMDDKEIWARQVSAKDRLKLVSEKCGLELLAFFGCTESTRLPSGDLGLVVQTDVTAFCLDTTHKLFFSSRETFKAPLEIRYMDAHPIGGAYEPFSHWLDISGHPMNEPVRVPFEDDAAVEGAILTWMAALHHHLMRQAARVSTAMARARGTLPQPKTVDWDAVDRLLEEGEQP